VRSRIHHPNVHSDGAHTVTRMVHWTPIIAMEGEVLSLGTLLVQFRAASQALILAQPMVAVAVPTEADSASGAAHDGRHAAGAGASSGGEEPVDVQTREARRAQLARIRAAVDGAAAYTDDLQRYLLQEDNFVEVNPDTYQPVKVLHDALFCNGHEGRSRSRYPTLSIPPQVVRVYTFNDGVLVAQELKAAHAAGKHKGALAASLSAPQRLVVEQWLPLASVAPVNLRDTEGARFPCIGWAHSQL